MSEETDVVTYLEAVMRWLEKGLDWKVAHEAHDHADRDVAARCLRDWRYIEHEGHLLEQSGP